MQCCIRACVTSYIDESNGNWGDCIILNIIRSKLVKATNVFQLQWMRMDFEESIHYETVHNFFDSLSLSFLVRPPSLDRVQRSSLRKSMGRSFVWATGRRWLLFSWSCASVCKEVVIDLIWRMGRTFVCSCKWATSDVRWHPVAVLSSIFSQVWLLLQCVALVFPDNTVFAYLNTDRSIAFLIDYPTFQTVSLHQSPLISLDPPIEFYGTTCSGEDLY